MPGIHIGLNLEHEARKRGLRSTHLPLGGFPALGSRCPLDEIVEHFTHTKVAQCRAEEDGAQLAGEKGLLIKRMTGTSNKLDFLCEFFPCIAQQRAPLGTRQTFDAAVVRQYAALTPG